jgi:beta-glucanase (GH16 family)
MTYCNLVFLSLATLTIGCLAPPTEPAAPAAPPPATAAKPAAADPAPIAGLGYQLILNEEFDGPAGTPADARNWSFWAPGVRKSGFNVEDACRLDGQGHLAITVRQGQGRTETGGVTTFRKFAATHGYWECRCQLQTQEGFWSAFWIQTPTMAKPVGDPATAGTEIDVMEYLATRKPNVVLHTLHWDGYGATHKTAHAEKTVPGLGQGFHTFAVRWDAAGYVFYTDGVETGRIAQAASSRPQHIILSCEVNGWGGKIENAKLPDRFVVDWVRVWQTPAEQLADRRRQAQGEAKK